jgi:hypothetical protein
MSSKPSVVYRRGPSSHDWNRSRPERDLRPARRKRRIPVLLLLATALFFAFLLADQLRPRVEAALKYVAKLAVPSTRKEVQFPRSNDSEKRSPRSYRTHNRHLRFSRSTELGPFEAYVLDGNRYIRVEGNDSYALVDSKTGKITWITQAGKHPAAIPKTSRNTSDGLLRGR